MYHSDISDRDWLIYGLISDVGWIVLLGGLICYMLNGADGLGTVIISALFIVTFLSAVCVLIGIVELISQRVRKLSRTLTKAQLVLGFGFTVYGALAAGISALGSVTVDLIFGFESGACFIGQCLMSAGGLLCFAFGLPILHSFHCRKDGNG